MKALLVLPVAMMAASAFASPYQNIYDTDGVNRETNYAAGPLTSVKTSSFNGREVLLYLFRDNYNSSCSSANLYDVNTGAQLAQAPIQAADIQGTTLTTTLNVAEADLLKNKEVVLSCLDENNNLVGVRHKVPGLPLVNLTASITPISDWEPGTGCGQSHCNGGFGRYPILSYSYNLNVQTNSNEGVCWISGDNEMDVALFNGQYSKQGVHTDQFTGTERVITHEPPSIVQKVTCENAAGSTTALIAWDISSETIEILDQVVYHR